MLTTIEKDLKRQLRHWKILYEDLKRKSEHEKKELFKINQKLQQQIRTEKFMDILEKGDFGEMLMKFINLENNIEISMKNRARKYIDCRLIFYYLMRKYTKLSLREIGVYVGALDHSTVVWALQCCDNLSLTDRNFRHKLEYYDNYVKEHFLKND